MLNILEFPHVKNILESLLVSGNKFMNHPIMFPDLDVKQSQCQLLFLYF